MVVVAQVLFLFPVGAQNQEDRVLIMYSRMYEAYIGRPGNPFGDSVKTTYPYDYVMENFPITEWTLQEKKRLAFMILTSMKLGTAGAPEFVRWIGDESKEIGAELGQVRDTDLVRTFGFSKSRLKHYRRMVELLERGVRLGK